jgi:hypothetical protein
MADRRTASPATTTWSAVPQDRLLVLDPRTLSRSRPAGFGPPEWPLWRREKELIQAVWACGENRRGSRRVTGDGGRTEGALQDPIQVGGGEIEGITVERKPRAGWRMREGKGARMGGWKGSYYSGGCSQQCQVPLPLGRPEVVSTSSQMKNARQRDWR